MNIAGPTFNNNDLKQFIVPDLKLMDTPIGS